MTEEAVETIVLVGKALASNQWTASEKEVIKWQFGLLGGFRTALWNDLARADDTNLAQMALAFPDEVLALSHWRTGDLGKRMRAAGLPI